jgi:hypothetical protein
MVMVDAKLRQIEESLFEASDWLGALPAGPAVRELRVRYAALVRVVGSWKMVTPHPDQLAAMLECVTDLCAAILRTCGPAARDGSRLGRRSGGPSRPAPRSSSRSPARTSAPPTRSRSSLGPTLPPLGRANVFDRTTRPPPLRRRSEPPS